MCEVGLTFANIDSYNKEMSKGMEDKLFFLKELPNDTYNFVDFGCADGMMINTLIHGLGTGHKYIGYDISETMIDLAKSNYNGPANGDVVFTNNWDNVIEEIECSNKNKTVLILSSVIHEVYSYGTDESVEEFWKNVFHPVFDYIIIRDMCPSKDIDRPSDKRISGNVAGNANIKQLYEFMDVWGPIANNKNMIHFLLKYRWKVNWKREVNENYFPIYVEELLEKFKSINGYNLDYFKRFRVPFLDKCIKEDFHIELNDYTHIKAIFSRKK